MKFGCGLHIIFGISFFPKLLFLFSILKIILNETKLNYVYFNDLKVQKKFEAERNIANIVAKQNSGIFFFSAE